MKKLIINSTIKVLNNIAEKSTNAACIFLTHQPREPKCLQIKSK